MFVQSDPDIVLDYLKVFSDKRRTAERNSYNSERCYVKTMSRCGSIQSTEYLLR